MRKLSLPLATIAMMGLLAASAARAEVPTELLGSQVDPSQAQQTVVIAPGTKWVNVTQGDVVRFESQGQDFAIAFNGPDQEAFNLARLAPAGALDHPVTVYVARNPDYD